MDELVDTHCHIQSAAAQAGERTTRELWAKAPDLSPDTIVHNAQEAGVMHLICVGCDFKDSKLAVDFAQRRPACWASIGIHPHEAQHFAGQQARLDEFASLVGENKVVAIGECGFDFYYTHSPKEAQQIVLRFQIEIALKYDLPLIFHVREAFDEFWPVFDSYRSADRRMRGVLHSFTDSMENMEKAVARGLHIGINGIATFTKSPEQRAVYKAVPTTHLLLETDAPFLTPTPYRGSINEPKHVRTIVGFLADLRDESHVSLAAATTCNARNLFSI